LIERIVKITSGTNVRGYKIKMRIGADFLFILIVTGVGWWLSNFDSHLTGEDYRVDFARRAVRTAITCLLAMLAVLAGPLAIFFFMGIGLVWMTCGAEMCARIFHRLVDPEDDRQFDPKQIDRHLDRMGQLVKQGRSHEALDLCKKLKDSSEGSHLALEATLHRLYQDSLDSAEKSLLLADVRQCIERGEFEQAEVRLKQILAAQPDSSPATLLLMRLYAVNVSRPDKALALLQPVEKLPHLHPAFAELARRSIDDWVAQGLPPVIPLVPVTVQAAEPELSVEELLQTSQFSTAVERLEKSLAEEPRNFDLWLKLAEVYAVHCADLNRAGKIIQKMERTSAFTAEEIEQAKAKLKEWKKGRR
jgi:tetratricopeptide (TPR) repeat protein